MSLRPRPVVCAAILTPVLLAFAQTATAQGGGRVVGEVVDEQGNEMEGVMVVAENPAASPPMFETTTGSDGKFAIIGLESGMWNFRAEVDGYHPQEGPSRITQSQNPPVNFELSRVRHALELAFGDEALEGHDPVAIVAEEDAADDAFNNSDWDTAIAGYQSVLEKLPQYSRMHFKIGQSYAQKSDYEMAISSFEAVLADDPENEEAQAGIARARMGMGDLSAADDLEQIASGLNASREDLYNMGEIQFNTGDVDTAAEWYEKASMVDPNWEKPLFKLALVALNKGDMPNAKAFFQKVIDVAPNSEEATQAQATLSALP